MDQSNWKDFFKDKLYDFQAVSYEHPSCDCNLYTALNNQRIKEADYLKWAQSTYELPIVKNEFFSKEQLDSDFWAKWADYYTWSPACLPIYEWEGVLMIGCLAPPENFPSTSKTVFVLTSASALSDFWHKNVSENYKEMFSNLYPSFQIPSAESSEESLDGIFEDSQPIQLGSLELKPSNNSNNLEQTNIEQNKPIIEIKKDVTQTFSKISTIEKKASPIKVEPIKPSSVPRFYLESLHKNEKNLLKVELGHVFNQLAAFFDKMAFFAIDFNQSFMIPTVWSESVTPPDDIIPISITERGVFKIVVSTGKPYHGYIVPNPFNESFFAAWNGGEIPEHITIQPLFCKNQIAGVLFGIGHSSAYNNQTLKQTEKAVKALEERFKNLSGASITKAPQSAIAAAGQKPPVTKPTKPNVA